MGLLTKLFSSQIQQEVDRRVETALLSRMNLVASMMIPLGTTEGDGVPHPYDQLTAQLVYSIDVYSHAAIRAIARDVASCPLIVQRRRNNGEWETMSDHELLALLEFPNPDESMEQIRKLTITRLLGAGTGYEYYNDDDSELYSIASELIKVNPDKVSGKILGYIASNDTTRVVMRPENIIQYKLVDPVNQWYGLPPAEVVQRTVLTSLYQDEHIKSYFKNGAILGTFFETDQSLQPEQRDAIRKQFNAMHAGSKKAYRTAVIDAGLKAKVLSVPISDAIPLELDELCMRKTLAVFGVPPLVIGDQDQKYANASEQNRQYQLGTCEDMRRLLETTFNHSFVMKRYDRTIRVMYDRTQVAALRDDAEKVSVRVDRAFRAGLMTMNEAREELGLAPVTPLQGGDEFYKPPVNPILQQLGSSTSEPPKDKAKQQSGDVSDKEDVADAQGRVMKRLKEILSKRDMIADFARAHNDTVDKAEATIEGAMQDYFDEQKKRVLKNIEKLTSRGRFMSRLWLPAISARDIADFDPDLLKVAFDFEVENAELYDAMTKPMQQTVKAGARTGQKKIAAISGEDISFDYTNGNVQAAVQEHQTKLVDRVNRTTYEKVKDTILQTYNEGGTMQELASKLSDLYDGFNETRALLIARTETNGIVNGAEMLVYEQAEVDNLAWITTLDPVTRPDHREVNGIEVKRGQSWIVGGESMRFPGDPRASAAQICNCRCTTIPVF